MGLLGSIAGAVVGGLFGKKGQSDAAEAQARSDALNREHEALLAVENREFAQQMSRQEYERQKEFAQMGIRWKAEDASAAGFHPLAALGSMGSAYSPTLALPSDVPRTPYRAGPTSDYSGPASDLARAVGDWLSGDGQNVARAEMATKTETERALEEARLRNAQLHNTVLEWEIMSKANSVFGQPANPPMPAPVGPRAPAGRVEVRPSVSISSKRGYPEIEAANTPLEKTYDMGGGSQISLPSKEAAESLEIMGPLAGPAAMTISGIRRWLHGPSIAPSHKLPDGYTWQWNPFTQSFRAVKPQSYEERTAPYGGRRYQRNR